MCRTLDPFVKGNQDDSVSSHFPLESIELQRVLPTETANDGKSPCSLGITVIDSLLNDDCAGGFGVSILNEPKLLWLIILYYVSRNLGNASGG